VLLSCWGLFDLYHVGSSQGLGTLKKQLCSSIFSGHISYFCLASKNSFISVFKVYILKKMKKNLNASF
jgi:hypothetical protein